MNELLTMWLELLAPILVLVFCCTVTLTLLLGLIGIVLMGVNLIKLFKR